MLSDDFGLLVTHPAWQLSDKKSLGSDSLPAGTDTPTHTTGI